MGLRSVLQFTTVRRAVSCSKFQCFEFMKCGYHEFNIGMLATFTAFILILPSVPNSKKNWCKLQNVFVLRDFLLI